MEDLWAVSMNRQFFCMLLGQQTKLHAGLLRKIKTIIMKVNKISKLSIANDAIEASTLFHTTTRSVRITANTTNWRAAQYACIVIGDECVGQAWWNYVCQYSAGVYLQCSHQQVFFIIKIYFPNLVWVGGS